MTTQIKYRRGQVSRQVWMDKKTHQAAKERLGREGKTFRLIVTKFLRWYGGTEEQDEVETNENSQENR